MIDYAAWACSVDGIGEFGQHGFGHANNKQKTEKHC
jgi:hypothetical protein